MFQSMKDTFASVREHLEKITKAMRGEIDLALGSVEDSLRAEIVNLRSDLRSVTARLEALEAKAASEAKQHLEKAVGLMERPQRIENVQMVVEVKPATTFGIMPVQSGGPVIDVPLPAGTHENEDTVLVYDKEKV